MQKIIPTEAWEQARLFLWAAENIKVHRELWLLNGSLNGVRLTIGQAVKAKKAGMKVGYPDVQLPVARQGYHCLYIEMKRTKGGRTDKIQLVWHKLLRDEGNRVEVCKGWHEARDVILNYLTVDNP